ncbi:SPOR domain-containing protein [uncultured Erythrobacter sp.]|uniref:SPOR domain-containing protein n=1 Tax=uncultured Erythrobacter sp. TaxID=263913 RepID=UPI0026167932|nr:SPOR domain-containing protein [uncultured Erythrobacter sp.]
MIEAEFEEIEDTGEGELDLSSEDSLPWLESDEDEHAGGYDFTQFLGFGVILLALLAAMVGGIWFLTNRGGDAAMVADGSTIEAPEGPYKERPEDPGGKEFAGTGNVAPVVGEGQTREGVMADSNAEGAESGSATSGTATAANGSGSNSASSASAGSGNSGAGASAGSNASSSSVVGVQVGAYGSRARAETGWQTLVGSSDALSGVRYRIVKGEADIGTVYRLQALASNRAAADQLCNALKADGLPCQVKP